MIHASKFQASKCHESKLNLNFTILLKPPRQTVIKFTVIDLSQIYVTNKSRSALQVCTRVPDQFRYYFRYFQQKKKKKLFLLSFHTFFCTSRLHAAFRGHSTKFLTNLAYNWTHTGHSVLSFFKFFFHETGLVRVLDLFWF